MFAIRQGKLKTEKARHVFGSDLNMWINPKIIIKSIKKDTVVKNDIMQRKYFFNNFIVGGKWDLDNEYFCNDRNFTEICELFYFKEDYEHSPSYSRYLIDLNEGKSIKDHKGKRIESIEAVDEMYRYYLNLIELMKFGYREKIDDDNVFDEIGVAISSKSEFFHFRTGHHRLSIAKMLQLDRVKVSVHIVHSNWVLSQIDKYQLSEIDSIREGLNRLRRGNVPA